MKSLVIGCITHYSINNIYNWVKSLSQSGFDGDKIMIVYEGDKNLFDFLIENEFKTYRSMLKYHIVVQRFYDMPIILRQLKEEYKYIISTDVKDVIFQYNPVKWLEENLGDQKKIVMSSECLKYKDENWGKNNMLNSYPEYAAEMMEKVIYNCGTLAGEFSSIVDFFEEIYKLSLKGRTVQPDQAALNILAHIIKPEVVNKISQNSAWCAQLGTVLDSRVLNESEQFLTEPKPIWDSEKKLMKTNDGKVFALVHQYDRIDWLQAEINMIIKSNNKF